MSRPTKRERLLAFLAMGVPEESLHEYAKQFLETGADPARIYPIARSIAGMVAELEIPWRQQRDELSDRLDLLRIDHEVTKGYRQHAEQQLAAHTDAIRKANAAMSAGEDGRAVLQALLTELEGNER
jgi:hypothetical protein